MTEQRTAGASHADERDGFCAWDRVWIGANIATMAASTSGPGRERTGDSGGRRSARSSGDGYGIIRQAAIAVKGGRIAWIGESADAKTHAAAHRIPTLDVAGAWITPGLIDCHTHLVYGGNRVAEFEQRLGGVSYEDIARAGGGIQATVRASRAASRDSLLAGAVVRARRLMAEGVTTLEIKSGYGLELETERRLLQVARDLGATLPLSILTTFLGLHALPEEFRADRRGYVDAVCGPWLEAVASSGLADAVDAFCESIAFTPDETERFLAAAERWDLPIHLHAGQLSDIGAAQLAARHGALSADHLEFLDADGVAALAAAGTVAVLLPGAYYTLQQRQPPPVAALREAGVPMAVATDCNPGTSPCNSLLLALNMACTSFGLTPEEALAGATREAARALGLLEDRGTLEVGKRADFALWYIDRPAELAYGLGANPCIGRVYGGDAQDLRSSAWPGELRLS